MLSVDISSTVILSVDISSIVILSVDISSSVILYIYHFYINTFCRYLFYNFPFFRYRWQKPERHFVTRRMFLHLVKGPKGASQSSSNENVLQNTALTFHTHQSIFPMALYRKQNVHHWLRPTCRSSHVCDFSHRNAHNAVLWLVHKAHWVDVFFKHHTRPNATRSHL